MRVRVTGPEGWNDTMAKAVIAICIEKSLPFIDVANVAPGGFVYANVNVFTGPNIDELAKNIGKYVFFSHRNPKLQLPFDESIDAIEFLNQLEKTKE